ncbi:DMP19 family protein [Luteimonas sp. SJ-92]|uniref:DMP19 family protein n=1 Tax=Luteimonas salinisoli TaxID=2752307 RepID=A0A853JG42_9GAMM|nr:DMP19 family protein [Luteimonas salinisoli]NZA27692.1 DMP19 family protein [Luteimonas salinisoli]
MDTLQPLFDKALTRLSESGFNSLSEPDRVLATIWGLEGDVNNGGFDQYYFNSSGDLARYAPTALDLIGATQMGNIVKRANALFGPSGPSPDRFAREEQLFALTNRFSTWDELDRAFYAYPDDISKLLSAYLRLHGYDA